MNWLSLLQWGALTAHGLALILWALLWGKIERKIWLVVLLGYMTSHRYVEASHASHLFNTLTALTIALVGLTAALAVRRFVHRTEAFKKALKLKSNGVESVAEQLAEHLVDLREEIRWYEHQAKANGLPTFPK